MASLLTRIPGSLCSVFQRSFRETRFKTKVVKPLCSQRLKTSTKKPTPSGVGLAIGQQATLHFRKDYRVNRVDHSI